MPTPAPPPGRPPQRTSSASDAAAQQRPASQESPAEAAAPPSGAKQPTPPPQAAKPTPPPPNGAARPTAAAPPASSSSGGRSTAGRSAAAYESPATASGSSRLAAGNALALARQSSDVLQDVELYQQVAAELGDVPALQSLLYTHRNVIGDGPTCDEQLSAVDASVSSWASSRRQAIETTTKLADEEQARQRAEALDEQKQREREIEAALARMTDAFDSVEQLEKQREERQLASERRSRDAVSERRAREQEAVQQYCEGLDKFEAARRQRIMDIDHADQRGKMEVEETLNRGLVLTAEERDRVALARLAADDRECIRLLQEAVESRAPIAREEAIASKEWATWADHLAARCGHQTKRMRLQEEQRQHVAQAEHAARSLLELEETRAMEAIFVDAIECGVKSASRRRLLDSVMPPQVVEADVPTPPATEADAEATAAE